MQKALLLRRPETRTPALHRCIAIAIIIIIIASVAVVTSDRRESFKPCPHFLSRQKLSALWTRRALATLSPSNQRGASPCRFTADEKLHAKRLVACPEVSAPDKPRYCGSAHNLCCSECFQMMKFKMSDFLFSLINEWRYISHLAT
ncbi:uncharacterized protein V6R79_012953 [Siganus canaliculatus]